MRRRNSVCRSQYSALGMGSPSAVPSAWCFRRRWLRCAQLSRIVLTFFIDRSVKLEPIGQHDDGLRATLTLIHRKSDRLVPVREQAAAQAVGVLDDPMAASVLPDEQAGSVCGARRFDVLLDH